MYDFNALNTTFFIQFDERTRNGCLRKEKKEGMQYRTFSFINNKIPFSLFRKNQAQKIIETSAQIIMVKEFLFKFHFVFKTIEVKYFYWHSITLQYIETLFLSEFAMKVSLYKFELRIS